MSTAFSVAEILSKLEARRRGRGSEAGRARCAAPLAPELIDN